MRRHQHQGKPRIRTGVSSARPPPSPAEVAARHLCALCGRTVRGFAAERGPPSVCSKPPLYFCSLICRDVSRALIWERITLIDKSAMELQAVKDARRPLAEVLVEMNLMAPFHDRSAAEIDRIIEACIDGFQASLRRQVAQLDPMSDPIPF